MAFRFVFLLAVLIVLPFPLGTLPHTESLAGYANKPWEWLIDALTNGTTAFNGDSSDTLAGWLQAGIAVGLAAIGAAVWSALDRKRTAYPRLANGIEIYVRYWLAASMITYGLVKLMPVQFPAPHLGILDQRVGDMSPMGLMWTFMGYSRAYQIFAGGAEFLGAVLLLWRPTRAIGAFVLAAVLLNVVVLNFCYDVPVKLGSLELFVAALALLAPSLVRIARAALGHAVAEVAPRERGTVRYERVRLGVKLAALAGIVWAQFSLLGDTSAWFAPPTPIDGSWIVERYTDGDVERPPLATDATRWSKLHVLGGLKGGGKVGVIAVAMTGEIHRYMADVDAAAQSFQLLERAESIHLPETWHYAVLDPDHIRIDRGTSHVFLHRAPPSLLETRGFHWVQDWAFNR